MKTRILLINIFILTLFIPNVIYGQNEEDVKVNLSLKDALSLAHQQNYEIKMGQEGVEAAKGDVKQTDALFLPSVGVSSSYVSTNDPLASFGIKLQQEIVTQSDFNPVLLNDPDNIENFTTQVMVHQPLINIDGWHGRKAAKAKHEAMKMQLQRTGEYVTFAVKRAYYGLVLAKARQNLLEKVYETTQRNYKLTKDYFDQGMIKEADLLEMKVRLLEAENQMKVAESVVLEANDGLSYLLGYNAGTIIIPSDSMVATEFGVDGIDLSINNRSDLLALSNGVKARENMYKAERSGILPKLNAFGSYNLHDDKLFGNNAKNWMVGAKLSIDLFKGNQRSGKVQKARAEMDQAQLQLNSYRERKERELSQAILNARIAWSKLTTSELAKESAAEAYRIRNNRFKQGLEKTTDLINSETSFAGKELEYLYALYQYHVAIHQIEFLKEMSLSNSNKNN
ncbi:TolC family protein [Puteibacter caeruleilacunae]|nr:TolC family protein [Puteibacter caeruleilacunae]